MQSKKRSRAQFTASHAAITPKKPERQSQSKKQVSQALTFDEIEKAAEKEANSPIKIQVLNQKRVKLSPNFLISEQISRAKSKAKLPLPASKPLTKPKEHLPQNAPICLRCAKRCMLDDYEPVVQFCRPCNASFQEYKQSHFLKRPRTAIGNKVNTQGKLKDFFSSKKKATDRIEIESDADDSDYNEKGPKRAQTV